MRSVKKRTQIRTLLGGCCCYSSLEPWAVKMRISALDDQSREHLESLAEDLADKDETYQRARQFSHSLRDGLLAFFFDPESELDSMTKNFGVF